MAVRPEYLLSPSRVATYWTVHLNPEGKHVPSVAMGVDATIELDLGWWGDLASLLGVPQSQPMGESVWD
eukprot:8979502-Pyramimonas_sp.AAC.1